MSPERLAGTRRLSVLARPAFANRAVNPYNAIVYGGMGADGPDVIEFTPRRGLFGAYDVFHVHWPESVFNHGLVPALVTTRALLLSMDRLKARGASLLWTAHNLAAHERRHPEAEAAFWREFVPRLDGVIALSGASLDAAKARFPALERVRHFVVPHPHYRAVYPDTVTRSEARRRLGLPDGARVVLFLGQVLAYKNVPALVRAVRRSTDPRVVLVVAGAPRTEALWAEVRRAAGDDRRVRLVRGRVRDESLQDYLRAADVVALPYRAILNSGSAVLAASFDRPVVLPRAGAGSDLRALLGDEWVHTYDGEIDTAALETSLERAARLPERTDGAHLSPLSPARVSAMTRAVYEALVA